jgi:hypothetical protein
MAASILVACCGILFDFLEHAPETISLWFIELALVFWGLLTVAAVGLAASGFLIINL